MNVYVAMLEKKTALCNGCYENATSRQMGKNRSWISLGHFDAIYTYSLETRNRGMFEALKENNQLVFTQSNEKEYFHSLYMLTNRDDRVFWKKECPFLGIIRVHFATTRKTNEAFVKFGALVSNLARKELAYRIYRTIDLSDAIIAIKAENLKDLLDFSFSVRKLSLVGKTYTYCGISMRVVSDHTWNPSSNDKLSWCTMRFSVRSFEKVRDELDTIQKLTENTCETKPFFVVGVDDVAVSWQNLPVKTLVTLFREWFFNPKSNHKLYESFSDITTRLGAQLDLENYEYIPLTPAEKKENAALEDACSKLETLRNSIWEKVGENKDERSWLKPLSELIITLSRMSSNALLDEYLYTMLPGVLSFLNYVDRNHSTVSDALCERFIENWSDIFEHIMRLEGQLTHQPELRPVLYDFPIMMLEYTNAFLSQATATLQKNDRSQFQINTLLFPRLGKKTATCELFSPDEGSTQSLLMVTVPYDLLYDPRLLLPALCHEVSHYVGERFRNRQYRRECFIKATARLCSHSLFEHMNKSVIETMEGFLDKNVLQVGTTMERLKKDVEAKVLNIIELPDSRREFMLNAVENADGVFPFCVLDWSPSRDDVRRFVGFLGDLATLFREAYADICMLYLLKMSPIDYIESLVEPLTVEEDVKKRRYEQVAIRIFIVLKASRKEIRTDLISDDHLKEEVLKIENCMGKNEDKNRRIPIAAIHYLQKYCEKCYMDMVGTVADKDKTVLRGMYDNAVSEKIDYTKFVDCIDQYRHSVLDNFSSTQ